MRGTKVCLFPKSQDYTMVASTLGSGPSKMLVVRKLFSYKSLTKLKSHKFLCRPSTCSLVSFLIGRLFAPPSRVLSSYSLIFLKRQVLFLACGVNATLQCFFRLKVGRSPAGSLFSRYTRMIGIGMKCSFKAQTIQNIC